MKPSRSPPPSLWGSLSTVRPFAILIENRKPVQKPGPEGKQEVRLNSSPLGPCLPGPGGWRGSWGAGSGLLSLVGQRCDALPRDLSLGDTLAAIV